MSPLHSPIFHASLMQVGVDGSGRGNEGDKDSAIGA